MSKFTLIFGALFFGPFIAHGASFVGVIGLIDLFTNIFTALVPILLGVAVVVFFWGIIKFIAHASDERERAAGKQLIIWGMIAIFVMVSLWGLVGFIQESFIPAGGGGGLGALPVIPSTIPAS